MPEHMRIIGLHVTEQKNGSYRAVVEHGVVPGVVCSSSEITRPTKSGAMDFIQYHLKQDEVSSFVMEIDPEPFDGSMY